MFDFNAYFLGLQVEPLKDFLYKLKHKTANIDLFENSEHMIEYRLCMFILSMENPAIIPQKFKIKFHFHQQNKLTLACFTYEFESYRALSNSYLATLFDSD